MSLDLDTRQRAMLQEMGVTVWQPEPVYVTEHSVEVPENAINKIAAQAVNTPATAINAPPRAVSDRSPVDLSANPSVNSSVNPSIKPPVKLAASPAVALQAMPAGLHEMDWPTLQQAAQTCQACQLCTGRKGIVFGEQATHQQADWLIVGDPPTDSDEAAGSPFTGESGVLLGNMLKAMGLTVAEVTLTPAVKCRTEGQSTGAQELAQCEAFLRRQVALTRPKMILAMGRYAAQALLAQTVSNPVPPLGQLRGVAHSYQSIPVVVTYSPANLLRNPADKAKAWADLCLARASLVSK
jgi:uracil-DNA glycosylase family 4